jgi:hypothetical protein
VLFIFITSLKMRVFALLVSTVEGWSGPSHRIVSRVAGRHISQKTVGYLAGHLHEYLPSSGVNLKSRVEDAMASASVWADTLGEELGKFHFSHTPYRACEKFDFQRDCQDGKCLVTGIDSFLKMASDPSVDSNKRADAVKWLIHSVADATQPLHTGFKQDMGGNTILITDPVVTNLHTFWDFDIIDYAGFGVIEKVADLYQSSLLPRELLEKGSIGEWIVSHTSETFTCKKAYVDEHGSWIESGAAISDEYIDDRIKVAIAQLGRAASVLREVLDFVAEKFAENKKTMVGMRVETRNSVKSFSLLEDKAKANEQECDDYVEEGALIPTPCRDPRKVQGIDISSFAKISYSNLLIITSKELLSDPSYKVRICCSADVLIGDTGAITNVKFDIFAFPNVKLDQEIIAAAFKAVGYSEDVELVRVGNAKSWKQPFLRRAKLLGIPIGTQLVPGTIVASGPSFFPSELILESVTFTLMERCVVIFSGGDWEPRNGIFRFNAALAEIDLRDFIVFTDLSCDDFRLTNFLAFTKTLFFHEIKNQKGKRMHAKHSKLFASFEFLAQLALNPAAQPVDPMPHGLSNIQLVKREDRPWLQTIQFTLDETATLDISDRLVVKVGNFILITSRSLLTTDVEIVKLGFVVVAEECLVDTRIVAHPAFAAEIFTRTMLDIDAKKERLSDRTELGAGRMARALKEWHRMLTGMGGKRAVAEKYSRIGELIVLDLYPKKS